MKYYLLYCLFLIAAVPATAQCNNDFDTLRLEINTDEFWSEVSWKIFDLSGQTLLFSDAVPDSAAHVYYYCLLKNECIRFEIYDSGGDGLGYMGDYNIYWDNVLVLDGQANIGSKSVFILNCPPGSYCTSAIPVDTGVYESIYTDTENWYRFTPDFNGFYVAETCSDSNTCGAKIWVYDRCENLVLTENIAGAMAFSESGCPAGASLQMALKGGKTYYLRLRYNDGVCDGTPLVFGIHYTGPIIGCTDPSACNYNPLATVTDTCLYFGNPNCPNGPDLVIDQAIFRSSMFLSSKDNFDGCEVEEGCLTGLGTRYLVNFSSVIKNIGNLDYYIGKTPDVPGAPSDQFFWDPCHGHWHYRGYAEYLLYDSNGIKIPIGTKNGFCVFDLLCDQSGANKYNCLNMGLSPGCRDIYGAGTRCQWIDITGVPAGKYNLVARINWDKSPDALGRIELDYANNWALGCFEVTYPASLPDVVFFPDCAAFVDCAGEVYGDAQPDCEGVCNGPALRGDLNKDQLRNEADIQAYLTTAIGPDPTETPCSALSQDAGIDVYDAALLQECLIYADNPDHWGLKPPCRFPTGFDNTLDLVYLFATSMDTIQKTVDIRIANPVAPQIGFQFSVKGLVIDSVVSVAPGFQPVIFFNAANGQIIGLAPDTAAMPKNLSPAPMLRIYYKTLTASTVCVDTIRAFVNAKYQRSSPVLGDPHCLESGFVSVFQPDGHDISIITAPNPFKGNIRFFIASAKGDWWPQTLVIRDISGRVLSRHNLAGEGEFTLDTADLQPGVYCYELQGVRGRAVGRVVKVW